MSATSFVVHRLERLVVLIGVLFLAAALFAIIQAQAQESKSPAEGRVIVIGEGSISVPPDYAQIRGSKPGERRGGRQAGTPNKKTALVSAAFSAATSNPGLMPLDFFLAVMRDPSIPADWRFRAAQAAASTRNPNALKR